MSETTKETPNRDVLLDFIRGLATILVVLGHTIQFCSGKVSRQEGLFFYNKLFILIYSFHMPLFAILSGYSFFFSSKKREVTELITHQIKTLILPIVSWNLLEFLLLNILGNFKGLSFYPLVKKFFSNTIYSFWFLWGIFFCSMIIVSIEKLIKINWLRTSIYCFVLIIGHLIIPAKYNLYLYFFLYPFFLTGFMANKYEFRKQFCKKKTFLIGAFSIFLFALLIKFYNWDCYVYNTKIALYGSALNPIEQITIDIYRLFIGIIGSASTIFIAKVFYKLICYFPQKIILHFITKTGQQSLGIYILNSYACIYFLPRLFDGVKNYSTLLWIMITVVTIPMYMMILSTIYKFPYVSYFLLGKKMNQSK